MTASLLIVEQLRSATLHSYIIRAASGREAMVESRLAALLRKAIFGAEGEHFLGLQMWRLHHGNRADILSERGRAWRPEFGVGVWLDQGPPTLWSMDELLRLPPGSKVRPPIWQVIRVNPNPGDAGGVWEEMAGAGVMLEFSVSEPLKNYLRRTEQFFRGWIREAAIRCQPFFVPLLKASTPGSPLFAELSPCFDPVLAYLRESEEDDGLVVFTRQPLPERLSMLGELSPAAGEGGANARAWRLQART